MPESSEELHQRYSRHRILDEVGAGGVDKLAAAKVLVLGLGGLGSPAAFYLAAAGVGTIGLADYDKVDRSNLQRQILHTTNDIGKEKTDSAFTKLTALNPNLRIVKHKQFFDASCAAEFISGYDIIIDALDNFPGKFLINDACYFAEKTFIHAGILRFDGQLMTVVPGVSACVRCVFDEPPPPSSVPSCAQAGVLGSIAGVIGSLQATEALKIILNLKGTLTGRMLIFDLMNMKSREVKLKRRLSCPLCGSSPRITSLADCAFDACRSIFN